MDINIGKIIKNARLNRNMQQKELAKILGVSSATVSAWELNKIYPSLQIFIKLVEVLDLSNCFQKIQQGDNSFVRQEEFNEICKEFRDKLANIESKIYQYKQSLELFAIKS